jgi:hypothetical protein
METKEFIITSLLVEYDGMKTEEDQKPTIRRGGRRIEGNHHNQIRRLEVYIRRWKEN